MFSAETVVIVESYWNSYWTSTNLLLKVLVEFLEGLPSHRLAVQLQTTAKRGIKE